MRLKNLEVGFPFFSGADISGWKRPGIVSTIIFLLLISGPPKLRNRDPTASLRGEVDWVILLHFLTWAAGGVWIAAQALGTSDRRLPQLRLALPHKIGLLLVFCIGLSTFVSVAPQLTAFKVYQMFVSLLFSMIFVQRYGILACLRILFWGQTVLCVAIAVAAFVSPELVYVVVSTGLRLRGDLIAQTAVVPVLGIILLLSGVVKMPLPLSIVLFGLFGIVLAFSRGRVGYVTTLVFIILVLLRQPKGPALRWFGIGCLAALPALYYSGRLSDVVDWLVREPGNVATLGGRFGLWQYYLEVTLRESPWLGLGYFAGGRKYGMEYGLGSAHSIFFEIFVGGGLVSLAVFLILCGVLLFQAAQLLYYSNDRISFGVCSLLVAVLLIGVIGMEVDSGPLGLTFWSVATILPLLRDAARKKASIQIRTPKPVPLRVLAG